MLAFRHGDATPQPTLADKRRILELLDGIKAKPPLGGGWGEVVLFYSLSIRGNPWKSVEFHGFPLETMVMQVIVFACLICDFILAISEIK